MGMTLSELMSIAYAFAGTRAPGKSDLQGSILNDSIAVLQSADAMNQSELTRQFVENFVELNSADSRTKDIPDENDLQNKHPAGQAAFILVMEGIMNSQWTDDAKKEKSERYQNLHFTLKTALADPEVRQAYMLKKFFKENNEAGNTTWEQIFEDGDDNALAEPFQAVRQGYISMRNANEINGINVLAFAGADKKAKINALIAHDGDGDGAAKANLNQLGVDLLEAFYKHQYANNSNEKNDILYEYLHSTPLPKESAEHAKKALTSFAQVYQSKIEKEAGVAAAGEEKTQVTQALKLLTKDTPTDDDLKNGLTGLISHFSHITQKRKTDMNDWKNYTNDAAEAIKKIADLCQQHPKIREWASAALSDNNETLAEAVIKKFDHDFNGWHGLSGYQRVTRVNKRRNHVEHGQKLLSQLKNDKNEVTSQITHLREEYQKFIAKGAYASDVDGEYRALISNMLKSLAPMMDDKTYAQYMAVHLSVQLTRYQTDSLFRFNASSAKNKFGSGDRKEWSQKLIKKLDDMRAKAANGDNSTGKAVIAEMATLMSESAAFVEKKDSTSLGLLGGWHKKLGTTNFLNTLTRGIEELKPRMSATTRAEVEMRKTFTDQQIKKGGQKPDDVVAPRIFK
jgi:hypothetical protein